MNKRFKNVIITGVSVFVFLLLIFSSAYAILGSDIKLGNANTEITIGSRPVFTALPSKVIALDIPAIGSTSAEVYEVANDTATVNIAMSTGYDYTTSCNYNIVWEWNENLDVSGQYIKTSGANMEYTVSGTATSTVASFPETQLSNYNSSNRKQVLYSGTLTAEPNTQTLQEWTITAKFYKTLQSQSSHKGNSYAGKIYVEDVMCSKD